MEFKTELCLLAVTITLFVLSAFLYTYQTAGELSFSTASYPYRGLALTTVGSGAALMIAASISYQKRSKNYLK